MASSAGSLVRLIRVGVSGISASWWVCRRHRARPDRPLLTSRRPFGIIREAVAVARATVGLAEGAAEAGVSAALT